MGGNRGLGRAAATGLCAAGAVAGYILLARPRQLRWGATGEEAGAGLPGDDIIQDADLVATRAITVYAPAERVWPWIAQLGQDRGGFYSYDRLENLFGCDIHSADQVVPQWQDIQAGDEVRLAPRMPLHVVTAEPEHALVLRTPVPEGEVDVPFDFTWAFVLLDRPDGTTRLLARERYGYRSPSARWIVEPVTVASFVMTRAMLRGIAARVHTDLDNG